MPSFPGCGDGAALSILVPLMFEGRPRPSTPRRVLGSIGAILLALGATQCVRVRASSANVPGYERAYHITCSSNHSKCVEKAGEVCPEGYDVISNSSRTDVTVSELGGSVYGRSTTTGEMTVGCTSGSSSETDSTPLGAFDTGGSSSPSTSGGRAASGSESARSGGTSTASSADSRSAEPPNGAAGFAFGMAESDAQATCEKATLSWQPASPGHFKCSGTPTPIGVDAASLVQFRDGKLSAVQLSAAPQDRTIWVAEFGRLLRALTDKYGEPASRDVQIPNYCVGEEAGKCLDEGKIDCTVVWRWRGGVAVTLFMGRTKEGLARIRLVYRGASASPNAGL